MNDLHGKAGARDLYPPIEPYDTGFLEVSGGHRLA